MARRRRSYKSQMILTGETTFGILGLSSIGSSLRHLYHWCLCFPLNTLLAWITIIIMNANPTSKTCSKRLDNVLLYLRNGGRVKRKVLQSSAELAGQSLLGDGRH